MRIIELSGAPREIGTRHGQLLAAEIRQLRRALLTYLARLSLYAGALPLYWLGQSLARIFRPYIPPRLQEEMLGVAAGAGVGLGTILLINVIDDLGNNSPRCSAIAAGGPYILRGRYLMGRNLDYPLFIEVMTALQTCFRLEPHGGLPLTSLAWPGYVGVCTGMNRAGVSLAQLSAMSRDRTIKGVPAALRFRQALEAGETLEETASLVMAAPGTIGNNLMLCSPRDAAVLEISARKTAVRRPEVGLLTATNHYQSAAMASLKGPFPPRPPFSPVSASHFTEAYSRSRDRRLRQLAAGRKLGPLEIQKILADPQIANPGTVVCTVFDPSKRTMWVAMGQEPPVNQGPFMEIRLWS